MQCEKCKKSTTHLKMSRYFPAGKQSTGLKVEREDHFRKFKKKSKVDANEDDEDISVLSTASVPLLTPKDRPYETYTINGYEVKFPFKAYACQLNMMSKIMKVLVSSSKENALLESPTGSGKSLSILCSVLGWLQHQKLESERERLAVTEEKVKNDDAIPEPAMPPSSGDTDFNKISFNVTDSVKPQSCSSDIKQEKKAKLFGKIYVTSRTHKQISQLVKELQTTPYRPKMAVLGSRNHLCLQDKVINSSDPNEECRVMLDTGGCRYFARAELLAKKVQRDIWDIEDLAEAGREHRACPYYAARALSQEADLIFAPYNYVCDPGIRDAMGISLKNAIVVLDEAHNIEDTARDSGSFIIDNEKLDLVAIELEGLRALCGKSSGGSYVQQARDLLPCYEAMKSLVYTMALWIKSPHTLQPIRSGDVKYYVFDESTIMTELERIDMNKTRYLFYKEAFTKMQSLQTTVDDREEFRTLSGGSEKALGGIVRALGYLFDGAQQYLSDIRVVHFEGLFYGTEVKKLYKLAFWCLNPGVVFKSIADEVKSVILTSGTLSPMDSFASELEMPFSVKMEASHVIENSRVWVGAVALGPSGLNTSLYYKTLDSFAYQTELGNAILHYIHVIPHGILCFVPSYAFLKKAVKRWTDTGIYKKINDCKKVFLEPQNSSSATFHQVLSEYYEAIQWSKRQAAKKGIDSGGAIFFAVYRGKVSEGLDFIDDNARAVIAIGIPFPNVKDIQVELKRNYNDKFAETRGLLTGQKWNEIQAYRALNQALGRCIRHRNDWGAIILFDQRFTQEKHKKQLSKWVREKVRSFTQFEESVYSLTQFTSKWREVVAKENSTALANEHNDTTNPRNPLNYFQRKCINDPADEQVSKLPNIRKYLGSRRSRVPSSLAEDASPSVDSLPQDEVFEKPDALGADGTKLACKKCGSVLISIYIPESAEVQCVSADELTDLNGLEVLCDQKQVYIIDACDARLQIATTLFKTFGKARTNYSLKYCVCCKEKSNETSMVGLLLRNQELSRFGIAGSDCYILLPSSVKIIYSY